MVVFYGIIGVKEEEDANDSDDDIVPSNYSHPSGVVSV